MSHVVNKNIGVWVFADHSDGEIKENSLLVVCEGRKLAHRLGEEFSVILVGRDPKVLMQQLELYGVDNTFVVEDEFLENYISEIYTDVVANLATRYMPSVILFDTSSKGADLASRVASKLDKGIVTNCIEFSVNKEGKLTARKPIHNGKVDATITWLCEKPFIATVNPEVLELERVKEPKKVRKVLVKPKIDKDEMRIRPIDYIKADPRSVDIVEADVVIGIGKGLGGKEHLDVIEKLADLLGASIGGSRIAVDKEWIPSSRQIGSSGKTISPKLYLALGISGSHQHTVGIRDSKLVAAINIDGQAPILKNADIGIVGDLHEVVPALNRKLVEESRGGQKKMSGKPIDSKGRD
jgi:electron transfer flavoprotein alpha subunit